MVVYVLRCGRIVLMFLLDVLEVIMLEMIFFEEEKLFFEVVCRGDLC